MIITPDTKDWTWVLARPCPECGFDAASTTPATAASALPELLPRWHMVLRRQDAAERPSETTWSALEYACHVRDVFSLFDLRLQQMLADDDPEFANWDQDQACIDGDYNGSDPAAVSSALRDAGAEISASLAAVSQDQWPRTGRRSDGKSFTVQTISGYFLHEVVHHLHDVDG